MSERGIFDFKLDGVENTYMTDPDSDSESKSSGWDSPVEFPEFPEIPEFPEQRRFDVMGPIEVTVSNRPGNVNPVVYTYVTRDSESEDSDESEESESILINAIEEKVSKFPFIDSLTSEEDFDEKFKTIPKEDYAKLINDVVGVFVDESKDLRKKKEIKNDFKTIIVPTISKMISSDIINIFFNSSFKRYSQEKIEGEIDLYLNNLFQNATTVDIVKESQIDLINSLLKEWIEFKKSPKLEKIDKNEEDLPERQGVYYEDDIDKIFSDDQVFRVKDCLMNDNCYMFIHDRNIVCYSKKRIKTWIIDEYLKTWRYWCVKKKLLKARDNSPTYINMPISESGATALVRLSKFFSVFHDDSKNTRILYVIQSEKLDVTSNFENLYAISDRSIVSSNYCQDRTDSDVYDLKICGGDKCHIFSAKRKR